MARRERITFLAVLALLVGGTLAAYRLLLGPEPGGRTPAAQATVPLTVSAVSGEVTVVRGVVRTAAGTGAVLRPDDAIETGIGGRVELSGGGYAVTLEEGGRFAVGEITAELSRFRLAAGLVSARVQDDLGRAVEIEGGPDVIARTRGGDVSVARTGSAMAVGVRRGRAEFTSTSMAEPVRATLTSPERAQPWRSGSGAAGRSSRRPGRPSCSRRGSSPRRSSGGRPRCPRRCRRPSSSR